MLLLSARSNKSKTGVSACGYRYRLFQPIHHTLASARNTTNAVGKDKSRIIAKFIITVKKVPIYRKRKR